MRISTLWHDKAARDATAIRRLISAFWPARASKSMTNRPRQSAPQWPPALPTPRCFLDPRRLPKLPNCARPRDLRAPVRRRPRHIRCFRGPHIQSYVPRRTRKTRTPKMIDDAGPLLGVRRDRAAADKQAGGRNWKFSPTIVCHLCGPRRDTTGAALAETAFVLLRSRAGCPRRENAQAAADPGLRRRGPSNPSPMMAIGRRTLRESPRPQRWLAAKESGLTMHPA